MQDKIISEHAPVILKKLLQNLEQNFPKYADSPHSKSFKLLMNAINSFLLKS